MATLIPALGSCVSRMTGGERRVAERLEQKLDDDYLLWYDVPIGPRSAHPDFVIIHPRRGILVLVVKDFRLSTLIQADRQTWVIHGDAGPKTIPNPLEQARQYAHQVVHALETGATRRPPPGQAGLPVELRRGAAQHHPPPPRRFPERVVHYIEGVT